MKYCSLTLSHNLETIVVQGGLKNVADKMAPQRTGKEIVY